LSHVPRVGGDRFAAADLQQHLRSPAALGLACVGDLRATAATTGQTARLQVHIRGRSTRRSEDRALLDLLAPWAPTQVVFHHAIDDALLQPHTDTLQPLLEKLGWRADEPIVSSVLTRAIARAQRP
jgi:preprotein translocase subunit SecA